MRLSAYLIKNYANINQFAFESQWQIRAGDPNTLYFQLVDLDQDGLRYLAGIGLSNQPFGVTVKFPSIDDALEINATAVQADAADPSVWKVNIASTQQPNAGNVIFSVTEGSDTRTFKLTNALQVEFPGNDGSC